MERQTLPFAPGLRLNGNAMTEHGNEQPCNADLQSIMVGESVSVNPLVSLVANTNFDGFTTFPPRTCNKNVLQHCRKHKREEDYDGDNIPSKKKRLSKDAWVAQISTSNAGVPYMDREVLDLHSSFAGDNNSETSTVEMPCEEMEHTLWKQQSQRTLTLQDIENRLTDDDELEPENCIENLPKIVFSDTLKEELKRDLNGTLTNKILKSNPHCMELVLWKPLSVFEKDKQTSSKECEAAIRICLTKTGAMCSPFLDQQEDLNTEEHIAVSPNPTFSNLPPPLCSDEEEMEL